MDEECFIVREPLVGTNGAVCGYELTLQKDGIAHSVAPCAVSAALIEFIARQSADDAEIQFGENLLFVAARTESLLSTDLSALAPHNIVFRLGRDDFAGDVNLNGIKALRARGFGVCLTDPTLILEDSRIPALVSHIEIRFDAADFATLCAGCNAVKASATRLVARGVKSWDEVDLCASKGKSAFVAGLYLIPRVESLAKGLNPAQALILQLMQQVRQNADVRQLENILKRDPAISYKLLRYINSVGFGLGAEIQSLRHAVTMLGYSPLYRWLSLLLATASNSGFSPALMQAAIIRGRFAELLGQGFLPKSEAENLFVAGMFSLLDRLLGIPMDEVLESIQLSDAVAEALLTRGGMYGPFLALAEACERFNGPTGERANSAFIDASTVNRAHLAALAWAQSLKV